MRETTVPTRQFTHREFALTLSNDAYLRYQSFNNADELKAEMLRLGPSRFEIGPMYSGRVSTKSSNSRNAGANLVRTIGNSQKIEKH